jgi:methionine synthase I (cobalamin-dependent)
MAALGGADAILLETQTHLRFADQVVEELERTGRSLPLIVSIAFVRLDGAHWLGGLDKPELAARWAQAHRDCLLALGVNCGNLDLDELVDIVKRFRRECDLPLLARPSAGIPVQDGDRLLFPFTPEMMAARVPDLIEAGVVLLGGCCGTTAEHIAAIRPVVEAWNRGLANRPTRLR